MNDFEKKEIEKLKEISYRVLKTYDIEVQDIQYLTTETNTYFKVIDINKKQYALRIYSEEETSCNDNQNEIFWLRRIREDTDLLVTIPVINVYGEGVVMVADHSDKSIKRCALFDWVPGKQLEELMTPSNYYKLGKIVAKLHNHSEGIDISKLKTSKKWNRVFYYDKEPIVYREKKYSEVINQNNLIFLDKVVNFANNYLSKLYLQKPILIHGDIHPGNIHVHNDKLYLIDFEDVMLGFPIQDIAILLSYGRQREDFSDLSNMFFKGYSEIRKLPKAEERDYKILIAARQVMFINYVLRIFEDPSDYVTKKISFLKDFMSDIISKEALH